MKELFFITSNQKKINNAKHALEPLGYQVNIIKMDTPEIQADDESEVAKYSAKWAANKLQKNIIVNDMGFYVNALNGFPGVYSKYVYNTIGLKGMLDLLKDAKDRSAYFKMTLAYCEPNQEPVYFEVTTKGTIAKEIPEVLDVDWDSIFINDKDPITNEYKTKAEWYYWSEKIYTDLANYLKSNQK